MKKFEYPNQEIFERDKFTCQYCGLNASKDFEIWWTANLNIDHIKPKKHGGLDHSDNLVVACRACNLYKGDSDCNSIEEARVIVAKKKEKAKKWFNKYVLKNPANETN